MSHDAWVKGAILMAVVALVLGGVGVARPQRVTVTQSSGEKTILVRGEGMLDVEPDTALIELGLRVEKPTAKEAQAAAAEGLTSVVQALRQVGVGEKEARTSRATLEPVYDYSEKGPPKIVAYAASGRLAITTKKLDNVGPIIDHAIAAGANQVQSIQFKLENEGKAKQQALTLALDDARRQADLIASETRAAIAEVKSVSTVYESSPEIPVPYRLAADKSMQAPDWSTPILAGTMKFQITVQVEYLLR